MADREMTLDEIIDKLPPNHPARKELANLRMREASTAGLRRERDQARDQFDKLIGDLAPRVERLEEDNRACDPVPETPKVASPIGEFPARWVRGTLHHDDPVLEWLRRFFAIEPIHKVCGGCPSSARLLGPPCIAGDVGDRPRTAPLYNRCLLHQRERGEAMLAGMPGAGS